MCCHDHLCTSSVCLFSPTPKIWKSLKCNWLHNPDPGNVGDDSTLLGYSRIKYDTIGLTISVAGKSQKINTTEFGSSMPNLGYIASLIPAVGMSSQCTKRSRKMKGNSNDEQAVSCYQCCLQICLCLIGFMWCNYCLWCHCYFTVNGAAVASEWVTVKWVSEWLVMLRRVVTFLSL